MGDADAKFVWWSITINNPTVEDRQALATLPRFVKEIGGQEEVGDTGTPHFQCYLHTQRCRMAQIKKWLKRAHIEGARNPEALKNYVNKSKTAVAGTQFQTGNTNTPMTMIQALHHLCDYIKMPGDLKYYELCDVSGNDRFNKYGKGWKAELESEYWRLANRAIVENPDQIALYTQPQYLRAWMNCSYGIHESHTRDQDARPPRNEITYEPPEASTSVQAVPPKENTAPSINNGRTAPEEDEEDQRCEECKTWSQGPYCPECDREKSPA
nr:MAG: replication associated protein [Cressdnaviricota sp.]